MPPLGQYFSPLSQRQTSQLLPPKGTDPGPAAFSLQISTFLGTMTGTTMAIRGSLWLAPLSRLAAP
jgi:hypothetical protein